MTNPTQPGENNPLAEANPLSLDEYFSRDPLGLSDQDIGIIVVELRRMRAHWVVAESQGKTKAPKVPKAPGEKKAVDLNDLGI